MMHTTRRKLIKTLGGGAAILGLSGLAGSRAAFAQQNRGIATMKDGKLNRFVPLITGLEQVMPPQPQLLDDMLADYAPRAESLATQKAYWLGFSSWVADSACGRIVDQDLNLTELGSLAWGVHTTSYWGGVELRKYWGPPSFAKLKDMPPPFDSAQGEMLKNFTSRAKVIQSGGDDSLALLAELMRDDDTRTAIMYTMAYNAGLQVIKTEDPPLGQRRPMRPAKPSIVRINSRQFMRVDYELVTPVYLRKLRSDYELAIKQNPDNFERALKGDNGQLDLRDVWQRGVDHGYSTWGGNDSQDHWSQDYFDESVHWTLVLSFGLEATALVAMVALINRDQGLAKKALMMNTLFLGATPGWMLGLLDDKAKLPELA